MELLSPPDETFVLVFCFWVWHKAYYLVTISP